MRIVTAILFLITFSTSFAQTFSTWGTEFYIPNSNGHLVIETNQATDVAIEDLTSGMLITNSYPSNTNQLIDMSLSSAYNSIDPLYGFGSIQKAIRVTSTEPINLRYSIEHQTFGGSSMILPRGSLGTNYTLSTHRLEGLETWMMTSLLGILFVTATEDNTVVEMTLTEPTANGFPVNTPFSITLDQGEILQIRGESCFQDDPITGCYSASGELIDKDFSGSTIRSQSSCAPISVHYYTTGYFNDIPNYGAGACCSDKMMEQYFPDNYWGNQFYAIPEQHVGHGNLFKVFSRFDNNDVFINGALITTLNANETFDTLLLSPSYLKTSKQSFLSQYFLSAGSSSSSPSELLTDPEIIFVLPIEYRSSGGYFSFPTSLFYESTTEYWVSIVTETTNIGNIVLDGSSIPSSSFTPFSSTSPFSWAYLPISEMDHEIYATNGSFQSLIIGNCRYGSRASYLGGDVFEEETNPQYFAEIVCYSDQPVALSAPEDGTNVTWSTGETSNSIEVNEPGVYSVESTDSCGNSEFFQSYFVTYDCDILLNSEFPGSCVIDNQSVPNVFTPNNDQLNDEFIHKFPNCINDFQFILLNRWGNKVFETSDHLVKWDGLVDGLIANESTYFWIVQGTDQEGIAIKESGFITVVR